MPSFEGTPLQNVSLHTSLCFSFWSEYYINCRSAKTLKGASNDAVADDEVERVYDLLNRRPRKRLGWKCPWEVYRHQPLHLL